MEKKKVFLDGFEENLLLIPLVLSVLFMIVSWIARLVGGEGTETETLFIQSAYYSFCWYVCLVMSAAVKKRSYLAVDVLVKHYPEGVQRTAAVLNEVLEFIALIVFLVLSVKITGIALGTGLMNEKAPAIPVVISYAAPLAGFLLSALRQIERLMREGIKK